jgi:hypothetical protein
MEGPVAPRSMRSAHVRAVRRTMLALPHVAPLTAFVGELRTRSGCEVPDFDPADGGVSAAMLFLLEKPGPMTSAERVGRAGSGFISRDNDDPTAEATFGFMRAAGIPREKTVLWNVVPGWNGTRKVTPPELIEGVAEVKSVLGLLPLVRVVVLVGQKAMRARPLLDAKGVTVFESPHPSPLVRASQPDNWASIPAIWAEAAAAAGL